MTQQKMTEINKSNDKLDMLVSLLTNQPDLIDVLLDSVLAKGKKKKPQSWRGRELTLFPNDKYQYLTPGELEAKKIVDALVRSKKLSKTPSVATMNKFYANGKIRALSKEMRFWAKLYFKQNHLDWKPKELIEVRKEI